jgi:hypothetical protein
VRSLIHRQFGQQFRAACEYVDSYMSAVRCRVKERACAEPFVNGACTLSVPSAQGYEALIGHATQGVLDVGIRQTE